MSDPIFDGAKGRALAAAVNSAVLPLFGAWQTMTSGRVELVRFLYEIGATAIALYVGGFLFFFAGFGAAFWVAGRLSSGEEMSHDTEVAATVVGLVLGLAGFAWWRFGVLEIDYEGIDDIGHIFCALIGLLALVIPASIFFYRQGHNKTQPPAHDAS